MEEERRLEEGKGQKRGWLIRKVYVSEEECFLVLVRVACVCDSEILSCVWPACVLICALRIKSMNNERKEWR